MVYIDMKDTEGKKGNDKGAPKPPSRPRSGVDILSGKPAAITDPPSSVARLSPKVAKELVKGELEGIVSRGIDDELMGLLGLPEFLHRNRLERALAFSSDSKLQSAYAAGRLFAPFASKGEPAIATEAYGIMITETTNQGYLLLLDAGRQIAVRARIYSYQDESARGWGELKTSLARALRLAEAESKNVIVVYDEDIMRRFDIRQNRFI